MFELTETIDLTELSGGSDQVERVKGGFPRIRICDEEFVRKINERKPREFSKKDVLTIKEIIKSKRNEHLFDLMDSPGMTNVIDGGNEDKKINGILISSIIGK